MVADFVSGCVAHARNQQDTGSTQFPLTKESVMAKRKGSKKRSSGGRGKRIVIGGRSYKCRAKRVSAFGRRKKVVRAYCARVQK